MGSIKNRYIILLLLVVLVAFVPPEKKTRIWLIGDSTVCEQPLDRAPITGWGTPFANYFDSSIEVANRARGGRSTRTFISEGLWQKVADSLKEGDYVLMQFGHNDEAKEPQYKDRYTSVPDYKTNLQRFITETRLHKANPILVTPVTRMRFDKQGNVMETHKEYSAAVWEVGTANNTPVIDLDSMSRKLLQQFGQENSKLLFMYVDSLQNPHYPNGRKDWTHFNEYGARRMAELVLFEITKQKLPLADKISKKTIL
jgi:lysophospholipase L1-like esterase